MPPNAHEVKVLFYICGMRNLITGLFIFLFAAAFLGALFLPLILGLMTDNTNWLYLFAPHILAVLYLVGKDFNKYEKMIEEPELKRSVARDDK